MTTQQRWAPRAASRPRLNRQTLRPVAATIAVGAAVALGLVSTTPAAAVAVAASVDHTISSVRSADGAYEISVDGRVAARVAVSDPAYEVETALSPDGSLAAVIPDHDGTTGSGLAVLDVAGGERQVVAETDVTSAVFAADGRLAFVSVDGEQAAVSIWSEDDTSTVATVRGSDVRVLGWADGDDAILVAQRELAPGDLAPESVSRVDVATGATTPVLTSAAGDVFTAFTMATVDGERLLSAVRKDSVFPCGSTDSSGQGQSSIVLVDEAGTVRADLAATTDTYRNVVWSTDGTQVAYELQGCVSPQQKSTDGAAAEQRVADTNGTYVLDLGSGAATKVVTGVSSTFQLTDLRDGTVVLGSSRAAEQLVEPGRTTTAAALDAGSSSSQMAPQQKVIPNVHIHQLWDTADDFNGAWACGPTSAVMDMASYQLPDEFPVDVSSPFPHRSPYGGYVSKVYSAYGYTFDAMIPDPSGNPAYGAWAQATDGSQAYAYMIVNYLDKHVDYGIGELDDVDPAWVRTQIDNNLMVLAMGSYSPAGWGHVATIVGYTDDGRFIVNDPYGPNTDGTYGGQEQVYTWEWMSPHYLIAA